MKHHPAPGRHFSSIEALESRIAPAVILVGAPDNIPGAGSEKNYIAKVGSTTPFVDTEGGDLIGGGVGPGMAAMADTFYLRLSVGDLVRLYTGGTSYQDFIKVTGGNAVAYFRDFNSDAEVTANEFVGLSLGKGANVQVLGSVNGDVVSNLDEHGTASKADDSVDLNSLVSQAQTIAGLNIGSNIVGSIYSGGSITNITVTGKVNDILAGNSANGRVVDYFPGIDAKSGMIVANPADGVMGPSISRITVDSLDNVLGTGRIAAGAGGAGALGGNLTTIKIGNDLDGFTLSAGAGGDGAGTRINGGNGGAVSGVYISGNDNTSNSTLGFHVISGEGGDALANGRGGTGGLLSNVYFGYVFNGVKPVLSGVLLRDNIDLHSGNGGSGKFGGNGGGVTNMVVTASILDDPINPANNEISVISGDGGATVTAGGTAGNGGLVNTLNLSNQNQALGADVFIHGGNAGTMLVGSKGGNGGTVQTINLLTSGLELSAGNGSDGTTGGNGGNVTTLKFLSTDLIQINDITVSAGFGGDGADGIGGKGGVINGITAGTSDLRTFSVNAGMAANGGSGGTTGGSGGAVSGINIIDVDSGNGFNGTFDVRTGIGGQGKSLGGKGGDLTSTTLFAIDLQPTLTAGAGGVATTSGTAGKGGSVITANISAEGLFGGNPISGAVTAGVGGAGTGGTAAGGAGGGLSSVNVNVPMNVSFIAGNGGDGMVQSGAGGSIISSAGFATAGSGVVTAGAAGTTGTKAALGGSIQGISTKLSGLRAQTDLTVTAGNGSHGGAGGNVTYFVFGSTADSPTGNVIIHAGNGSAEGAVAGVGGKIDQLDGAPSAGTGKITEIRAGNGGGVAGSAKSGAGGGVSNTSLTGLGDDGLVGNNVTITVEAGNAGASAAVTQGGIGGSVLNLMVSDLDVEATFQRVAAGDGAAGTVKGGLGGSVTNVSVIDHDIGVRQGSNYGYLSMGGVFAGAGGAGPTVAATGLAGSVRTITADGIAAIVAGRAALPQFVEVVEKIIVTSSTGTDLLKFSDQDLAPSEAADGGDPNYRAFIQASYSTNNLIGFVVNPTAQDGNKFHFTDNNANNVYDFGVDTPIDGLVAAKTYKTTDIDLVPEARVTGTVAAPVFYDYNNRI